MKEIAVVRSLKLAYMQFKKAGGIFCFVFFVSQKKGIVAPQCLGRYLLFSVECFHELNILTEMLLSGSSLELLYCLLVDCISFRVTILFNCVIQRSALVRLPNSSPTVLKISLFFIIFKLKFKM